MKWNDVTRALIVVVCACGASCNAPPPKPGGPPMAMPPCENLTTPPTVAFLNTPPPNMPPFRNGEFTLAFDPRTTAVQGGNQWVYAAGQELTLAPGAFPSCIIAKKTVVYVSSKGGAAGSWSRAGGNQDLPGAGNPQSANLRARLTQSQVWATDEVIKVASDGTVYLALLDTAPDSTCTPTFGFTNDPFDQVELYAAQPGAASFKVAFARSDGERARSGAQSEFYDLPQLAVNPTDPTQAVVFFTTQSPDGMTFTGDVCTMHKAADGSLSRPNLCQTNFLAREANIAFDALQPAHLYGVTPAPNPVVTQFLLVGGAWTPGAHGGPVAAGYTVPSNAGIPLDPGDTFGAFDNSTPAIAVGTVQTDTEPSVFLAVKVPRASNASFPTVQIFGTKVSQMGSSASWGTGLQFPEPPGTVSLFHPGIAFNAAANALDVVALQTQPAATADQTPINTVWTRFDPFRLQTSLPAAVQIVSPNPPLVRDLPAREPQFAFIKNTRFVGEYLGLDVRGTNPFIAYPAKFADQVTTMAISFLSINCDSAEHASSALTDDAWECTCACQNLHTQSSTSIKVQGCAPSGATSAAACASVCPGRADGAAPFSDRIACGGSGFPTTARRLTQLACRVSDGTPPGGLVTDAADVVAASDSSAAITLHQGTSIFQTALAGTVSLNLGGLPSAGTTIELARLDLEPEDLFTTVGSTPTHLHDFALSHRGRLRGVFTDATHFALSPLAGELDLSFTISQSCIDPCPDQLVTIHKTNFQPVTGAVDLVAKTIAFDINETSGADGASVHFGGAVTAVPPDTDQDGVFDGADNCPLVSNPTQQRVASPQITAPANLNVTTCTNVALGTPQVTDVCGAGGVVVTNDAPAIFPLGKTVVTWTATDARGNSASTKQTVTAALGDSATCCPSGTHLIMGTAGADTIVGTEGADCILGLGGDDTIDARGGNDFVSGGAGRDTIQGGFGNDFIWGGDGDDTIDAGPDDDMIDGGPGIDVCAGSTGHNTILACEVSSGG